jgi:hypothetical protein
MLSAKHGGKPTDANSIVEVIMALAVPVALVAVVWHRIRTEKGLGYRSLQFLAIGVVMSIGMIPALEGVLDRGGIGTLPGAVVGYLVSTASAAEEAKNA